MANVQKSKVHKLLPSDPKLWVKTLRDMDKMFAGKPSSFTHLKVKAATATPADVKAARKATSLSQSLFANSIGVSTVTVRAWENGRRKPRLLETKLFKAIRLEPKFVELMANI